MKQAVPFEETKETMVLSRRTNQVMISTCVGPVGQHCVKSACRPKRRMPEATAAREALRNAARAMRMNLAPRPNNDDLPTPGHICRRCCVHSSVSGTGLQDIESVGKIAAFGHWQVYSNPARRRASTMRFAREWSGRIRHCGTSAARGSKSRACSATTERSPASTSCWKSPSFSTTECKRPVAVVVDHLPG